MFTLTCEVMANMIPFYILVFRFFSHYRCVICTHLAVCNIGPVILLKGHYPKEAD